MKKKIKEIEFYKTLSEKLKVSDKAITWMVDQARPMYTKDFKGYLFNIKPNLKVICAVDIKGNLFLLPADISFRLTLRKVKRIVKYLILMEFLQLKESMVFPEFEEIHIPFDDSVPYINECLFKNPENI